VVNIYYLHILFDVIQQNRITLPSDKNKNTDIVIFSKLKYSKERIKYVDICHVHK
jgi:hypothetical protein